MLAGAKLDFKITGTVGKDTNAVLTRAETVSVEPTYYVPYDAAVTFALQTETLQAIRDRFVTVTVDKASWFETNKVDFFLFNSNTVTMSNVTLTTNRKSVTTKTDAEGKIVVRVYIDLTGAAQTSLDTKQELTIRFEPAMEQNGVALNYEGCDASGGDCELERSLQHEAGISLSLTDTTVVTLTGYVPFIGVSDCFAPDLIVEAYRAGTNTLLGDTETADDGSFSIVVQQNQAVQLRLRRTSVPDYYYADANGAIVSAVIDVSGKSADTTLTIPFAAATTIDNEGLLKNIFFLFVFYSFLLNRKSNIARCLHPCCRWFV